MVVGRVSAHAAHYVSAYSRWLVAGPPAKQLINNVLRSKGLAACTSPDSWKDSEDLVTSSHEQSMHPGWDWVLWSAHAAHRVHAAGLICSAG